MADQIPFLPKEQQEAILSGPAMAPPPGVTPNFEDPPNRNALAHAVMATCIVVSTFCLLVRVYLAILSKRVKVSEALILCAFGNYIGWAWCAYHILFLIGYFVHQWNVVLRDMIPLGYYISVGGVFYSVALPCLKIAILLEWMQTFVATGTRNFFWYTCLFLILLQALFGVAVVIALNLVCVPYEAIYDFTIAGTCINKHTLEVTSATIHLFTDVTMVFLPQRVIWSLRMSLRKKLGVSIVFGLGLLACVSAVFRLQVTVTYANAEDATYTVGPVVFWAYAEMTCGFVVSCMPSVPRLLHETGLLPTVKRMFGMHVTTAQGSNGTTPSSRNITISKPSTVTDKYRKIDDDLMMDDLSQGKSESTERLHRDAVATKPDQPHTIVRTTQVTVEGEYTRDAASPQDYTASRVVPWQQSAAARGQPPSQRYYGRAE